MKPLTLGPALFSSMGWQELLIILAILLLLFGSSRLPLLARSLARTVREFKSGLRGKDDESALNDDVSARGADEIAPSGGVDAQARRN